MSWMDILLGSVVFFIISLICFFVLSRREVRIEEHETEMKELYRNLDINDDISDFIKVFTDKRDKVKNLVDRKFPAGSVTNNKFSNIIDYWNTVFNENYEMLSDYLGLEPRYAIKHKDEIDYKINLLRKGIDMLGFLESELVINMDKNKTDNEKIKEIVKEMQDLIESVESYK